MSILELFWMIAFFIMGAMCMYVNEFWYKECVRMNDDWHRFYQKTIEEAYKSEVKE